MITETTTVNYEIYNTGIAPLLINSVTLPQGFTSDVPEGEFSVAGGEKKQISITLPADNYGFFGGDLVIEYTNFGKDMTSYTLGISGTVVDPSKNLITFDDGAGNDYYPEGSVRYTVYISTEDGNKYLMSTGNNPLYITPLMTATAGEGLTFDAKYNSSGAKVEVMISTDRQNWTTIQTVSKIASDSYWTTYSATIPDAGDYYIGFKLTNARIDNIYGLVYATAPEHDLLLVASNIPETGKQNNDYTATISIGNVGPNVETAGNYTATLYVDGEAVATSNDVDLPVAVISGNYNNGEEDNYTVLSFTFKPHIVGTYPAYIEVISGDALVKTEEVSLTINQEVLESDLAVGEPNSTSSLVPFYGSWWDEGSNSDFYYTAEQLEQFGIKKDDVISAITFKGTPAGTKDFSTLKLEAWVALESASSFVAGSPDTDNMKHVVVLDGAKSFVSGQMEDFVLDLSDAPIVYDGESILRIYTYGKGSTWVNVNFEVDKNISGQAYYRNRTNPFSSTNLPVAHISLAVQAKTLTGVVIEEGTETPVVGATVTIRNDENDIEYFTTTDEEGAYSIDVVQSNLTYTTTVTADGYETLEDTEVLNFSEESQTKNFALTKIEPVMLTISKYGYSTFYYSNSAYIIPEGVTASIVNALDGKTISLTELNGVIPAGCAVILDGEPNMECIFEPTSEDVPNVDNMLKGTDERVEMATEDEDYKYYVLSAKNGVAGFYYGSGGSTFYNEAHKAYLPVPLEKAQGINCFVFDQATGIQNAQAENMGAEAPAYNLSGQRVNKSYKGVVIINGKKMLNK